MRAAVLLLVLCACASKRPFVEEDAGTTNDSGPFTMTDTGSNAPPTEVYGQTATTLYRLNPVTKEVTKVGIFDGCIYVNDIAIDRNSTIYGVTGTQLVRIDRGTAKCDVITTGAFPNSLSFVPAGTLDPTSEALVGYEGADYVRIDVNTGNKTKVGKLSGGYTSSGDIVSVIGGSTYLTVKGNGCNDCLVQIDAKTGDLAADFGSLGFGDVFGVAFWGGRIYGFANDGTMFEVQIAQGQATSTPIQNGMLMWAGAGSTTSAPLVPPK